MSLIDWTEGDIVFFSGLLTKAEVSSSVVLLAKQDIPNFEADFRSKVLEELVADKSSLEACADEVFNNEEGEEIEPILGTSSINGLEPDGGEEPEIISFFKV